jgi:hypothetical protein
VGDLAPGASATVSASYAITQGDLDTNGGGDGDIDNTATADSDQTDPVDDSEEVPLALTPSLSLDKQVAAVDAAGDGVLNAVGDIVDYALVVSNTGNVTLTNVTVTDPLTGTNASVGRGRPGPRRERDGVRFLRDHPGRPGHQRRRRWRHRQHRDC